MNTTYLGLNKNMYVNLFALIMLFISDLMNLIRQI